MISIPDRNEGVLEAFQKGSSASTWLSMNEKPIIDISENIKEGYATFFKGIDPFNHE